MAENEVAPVTVGPDTRPETKPWQDKLVRHCLSLYEDFGKSQYRTNKIDEIKESHRTYDQKAVEDDWPFPNASNIVLPLTAITVDNTEPRLVAGLIGKEPIVQLEMVGTKNTKDEATEVIEEWFNKELMNVVKIKPVAISMVHTLLLEGTLYPVPKYEVVEKKKRVFVLDGKTGKPIADPETGLRQTEELNELVREGGGIDLIPFTDIYVADDVGTIEEWEAADKIRKIRPTYAELQRTANAGMNIGWMNIGPWLVTEKTKTVDPAPGQEVSGVEVTGKEVIEAIECHVTYPIYQDQEKEENEQTNFEEERIICTIALQSQTLIRMCKQTDLLMENDSIIKRMRLYPEAGKSYGTAVYGKLKGIQEGGSELFNLITNITFLTMMPWYFYDAKSGLRGETEIEPGKGIKVDDVAGIKMVEFAINPQQYLQFFSTIMMFWEKIGNISDTQIGRTREKDTTATEIMTVVQEGNIKHNYSVETFKEEFMMVLRTLYDMYYERMNPEKKILHKGVEIPMPWPMMRRDYRFLLTGSTESANKLIRRKEREDLMQMLGQDPYIIPTKPREELLEAYGENQPEEWINPQVKQVVDAVMQNPELAQVIGQYMAEKAAVQDAIGTKEKMNANRGAAAA